MADAFSAMTTTRPYRKALPLTEALKRLGDAAGTQLQEELVDRVHRAAWRPRADAPMPGEEPAHALAAGAVGRVMARPRRHDVEAVVAVVLAVILALLAPIAATRAASLLWTLTASPLIATTGVQKVFTLTATNDDPLASLDSSREIGCVIVDVPGNFTVQAATVVDSNAGEQWHIDSIAGNRVVVHTDSGGERLEFLGWVRFTVTATAHNTGLAGLELPRLPAAGLHRRCRGARHPADRRRHRSRGDAERPRRPPSRRPSPRRSPTPAPTARPTPTPLPLPVPLPSLPIPLPSIGLPPGPEPEPTRAPSSSAPRPSPEPTDAPASAAGGASDDGGFVGVLPPPGGGSAGGGGGGGGAPAVAPVANDAPRVAFEEAQLDLGSMDVDLLAGIEVWSVPAATLGVPGILLLVWVALQAGGALAWIPAVKRLRGDEESPT